MSNKSKIQKLAELTTAADTAAPDETPETPPIAATFSTPADPTAPRPQLPPIGQQGRKATDPAPQRPMLTQADLTNEAARRGINPITGGDGAPEVSQAVQAMLIMTGLEARWAVGFWKVTVRDASKYVNMVGGGKSKRWQTGVGPKATDADWMAEINRFWKDTHPNEPLPFGGV